MISLTERKQRSPVALAAGGLVLAALALAAPASAQQRDPVYAQARAAGLVGEKTDGYLGFPVPPSADLRHKVEDLNIKRKAVYAERAQASGSTVEEYAFTAGCLNITRTTPGEKYQAPDGSWQTRGAGAPLKDNRCP